MNRKINTICFIFLLLFFISAVSASDCENETQSSADDVCTEENVILRAGNVETTKQSLEKNTASTKQKVTLKVQDVTMYYEDGHKLSVTLTDKNKKPISNAKLKIAMNDRTYTTVTDKNGVGSLGLHLKSRTYSAIITFEGTNIYEKASTTSTVTIKSTIKCGDFTKYYKNTAAYTATFYDTKGNVLKNTPVKFQINAKAYSSKTDSKGVAKLNINMKPGTFSIAPTNPKTSEQITRTLSVKSLIETKNLVMNENDGSTFYVKVLDCNGKSSPNKKVT